jgi:hypothetical protein
LQVTKCKTTTAAVLELFDVEAALGRDVVRQLTDKLAAASPN